MPYVRISTTKKLGESEKVSLYEKVGAIMPILPGKTYENTMIHIDDGCFIRKGGQPDCLIMDVHLLNASPEEAKKEFCETAMRLFEKELGIPQKTQTVNITELPHWASHGVYR